jgi:hypothetical protein
VSQLHMCQSRPIGLGGELMAFHWLFLRCISLHFVFLFSSPLRSLTRS